MTLGENKKIMLSLIEQYAPNNVYLTDDEGIQDRINVLYNAAYFEMARFKKIRKTETVTKTTTTTEHYTEYSMPSDIYQLEKVMALDTTTHKSVNPEYYLINDKIYINDASDATYKIMYFAYPTPITELTANSFVLELDLDVQGLLPYVVASDILKSDQSANYSAFENRYLNMRNNLDPRIETPSMYVEEKYIL